MEPEIIYRTDRNLDPEALEALFVAVGFRRSRSPELLCEMVMGSRWVASAWDGEKLIGFARAISDVCSNAYISTVAVLPEYQRRGIGRKLMEMLMEGHEGVKFVLHTSEAGERLYRSLGFVDASRMMVRLRAGEER